MTSVATHISRSEAPLGTIGQLLPGTEMKVISEDGKLCGPGEEGELWLSGQQMMKGYWRKPKETAEAFDKDGFMRTGDVVFYDKEGYTFICDRIKELIKCNEKQVAPAELESIILEVPGVTDCCVVGLRDEKYGEVTQGFVVSSHKNGQAIQDHVNWYGMTETSVATHISHPEAPLGTIGQLLPGTEMRVISENGKLCGPGEKGELWLRCPQIMKGYWRKPKETVEAFDKDGFMRTGDVVYYDKDGYTFICDRIKELFKCIEKQISAELESIILEVPGVTDCCVVGLRDEKHGEVPQAFVVSSHKNGQAIQDHVNSKFAPYNRLRGGVGFVEAMPRTPTGKLLRRQLKKHATSNL